MDSSVQSEVVLVEEEEEEEFVDSSSDSVLSEEWQDLSKSDYAKVIFCNLYHDADNGGVGCKFQITDNVHEDPCDFVGLFKVGESQCLVSKMLSETECEEDGKLLRCVFTYEELPSDLQDGFYQFMYITRDQEVCGASTPFEVKQAHPKEDSSDDDIVTENAENDFVLVQHILEKKNRMLEELLAKFRAKNLALSSDMNVLLEAKSKLCQEKEEVIENLHQEIISLKADSVRNQSSLTAKDLDIKYLTSQLQNKEQAALKLQGELDKISKSLDKCQHEKLILHKDVQMLKQLIKEKETYTPEPEQRILLEQLDDQKFMIRALEDSKQLALKEMSDLSESLSKRTKVLNQTRCELATCKGKVKEAESVIEKQNEEISRLRVETKDMAQVLEEKEEKLKLAEKTLASTVKEVEQEFNMSEEGVKKLMVNAFAEAEKFLVLVDKIVEKIDFNDMLQEKAFYELKIMFFVLLGKMKKPNELSDSKETSLRKNHGKKDKLKKTPSRTLPSCQGETSTEHSDNKKTYVNAAEPHKEIVTTHNKEVQVCEDSSVSETTTTNSTQSVAQENNEKHLNKQREMLIELNIEIAKKKADIEFINSEKLNIEIAKKKADIEFINSEKVNFLKNESMYQEALREHAARIVAASELYKKQYVEIEKLKKKLRHVQRHSAKASSSSKVIGYESSSTAEDVSPLISEKAPPSKRPRKTSAKAAEKAPKLPEKSTSSKIGERQPQMLKVILKSHQKKAEKAALKTKKTSKTPEKLTLEVMQESTSVVDEKAASSQEKSGISGGETCSANPYVTWAANVSKLSSWPEIVKETSTGDLLKNVPSNTGKSAPVRSISDSDTGEHVLRNTAALPHEKEKPLNAKQNVDAAYSRPINATSDGDKSSLFEPGNRDLQIVQKMFTEEITKVKTSALSMEAVEEKSYVIPCVLCEMVFEVTSLSNVKLMNHLENEHQISMCPVCGQLFEASFPKKYLMYHVNDHFNSE